MTDAHETLPTEEPENDGPTAPKPRVQLAGISSRAYEHPADRAALTAMRKVPGFDLLVRKAVGLLGERRLRYLLLGGAVRVNERQFKHVSRLYDECLEILDVDPRPPLFVAQTPFVNAGAIGVDEPFIVLNSATLELLNEDEIRVVIGHELGHILSGHVLFKTMLKLLLQISVTRLGIPLIGVVRSAIIAALLEWDRKSELSSDRAGLLCGQDPWTSYRLFMKMAGGKDVDQMDITEFVKQAEEYESGGDQLGSVLKLLNLMGRQHPFWVLRLAELKRWVERGDFERILGGEYARREDDAEASVAEEVKESARSYQETAKETQDPLVQSLRNIGAQIAETGSSLFGSIFKRGTGDGGEEAEDDLKDIKEMFEEIGGSSQADGSDPENGDADGPVDDRR